MPIILPQFGGASIGSPAPTPANTDIIENGTGNSVFNLSSSPDIDETHRYTNMGTSMKIRPSSGQVIQVGTYEGAISNGNSVGELYTNEEGATIELRFIGTFNGNPTWITESMVGNFTLDTV